MNQQSQDFLAAIQNNYAEEANKYYLQDRSVIFARDGQKRTTLQIAAMNQYYDLVQYLILIGVDLNAQDNMRFNPFLWGCIHNDLKLVKIMVEAGADLECLTRFGGNGLTPASEKGNVEVVEYLLTQTDINPNHTNYLGWTALIEAVTLNGDDERQQKVVELLLTNGADPNMVDSYSKTPFRLAKERGNMMIAEIVAKHGGV
ncbi:ankyrin repeat domain-containing protein [Wohlfahrtiimonas populi]|uniref:ankyrin repeat domain-containing protein n=1 Tax=Wohlfahrtiimonas populi TaxID=1940240 RepID=UPI00098CF8F9|nr:ankyrin repeat domain-containing protein [Wohlfahrtiimonas populi]